MIFETLIIGIIVAFLYVEVMDIYPGGIIVPAYVALSLESPPVVLSTIIVAFLSLFTYKGLSRFLILFGKRRFVMLVLLGVIWAQIWQFFFSHFFSIPLEYNVIGWLIPGLLANNLEKQKIIPTLASLFIVSVITYFLVRAVLWII